MIYFAIPVGILLILLGTKMMRSPDWANRLRDRYRIQGKREYTSYAQGEMVLTGLVLVLMGILLIVLQIVYFFIY